MYELLFETVPWWVRFVISGGCVVFMLLVCMPDDE